MAADARVALSRLRPALERLHDDGLDTGVWTDADPDAFSRQAERVHWVRVLANSCTRLGAATPHPVMPGPMTRLADAAAVTAVLHGDVLTDGQRWAIVAGLARTANHLVTAASGGGAKSPPDVDRALIIAEASAGVLFQFAALDPPAAADYDALHRPVPAPAARPTSVDEAALEASAALVHATRPGTGPHTIADIFAITTAAKTACTYVATGGAVPQVTGTARDAARAWDDVRDQLGPFNDGSRRRQPFRPPAVDHALALHRALQPPAPTTPSPAPPTPVPAVQLASPSAVATVIYRLAKVAQNVDLAIADGAACGQFMAYAVDVPQREARVPAYLAGRRAPGLVTVDTGDLAPARSAVLHARKVTADLVVSITGEEPRGVSVAQRVVAHSSVAAGPPDSNGQRQLAPPTPPRSR